jgi:peptidoglycan/LPS O-acetylase OafA/YrhL
MSTASPAPLRRSLQLDFLRGIAILMVLVCHSVNIRKPTWDEAIWRAGWSGVDLFFVVSGFLISGLLFSEYRKTGEIRFRRFAVRRAIKIYPAFWCLVLFTVLLRSMRHPESASELRPQLLHDLLFVQSYLPGTWGHFWSLSVEEHFYILLPLTMFFLMRASRGRSVADPFTAIPKLFLIVAPALLLARLITARNMPFSWQTHLFPTHLRLDSLLFGVVIAYWYHFHRERFTSFATRRRLPLFCAAAVLLSPLFLVSQYDPWMYTYGFTALFVGYGCLLVSLLHVPVEGLPLPLLAAVRVIAYVGTFSYSIYLWHIVWLRFVQSAHLLPSNSARLLTFYLGSILLGILTAKIVEFPALRLRDQLFPAAGPLLPVAPERDLPGTLVPQS